MTSQWVQYHQISQWVQYHQYHQITSPTIVYSVVYSVADQRKHQSSTSLTFVWGNSPVTSEFPTQRASNTENVIMIKVESPDAPEQTKVHYVVSLHWCHNDRGGVSDHQPHDCLLSRLFRRRTNKTSKLRVTGLCTGNSPATGEFPAQRASYAEDVSIWWRHHVCNSASIFSTFMLTFQAAMEYMYLPCLSHKFEIK